MNQYDKLLREAYENVKVVEHNGERFDVPKVRGQVSGNCTIIINIVQIAGYLRRDVGHLARFLQKELAVSGRMDNNRLYLKTKLNSAIVNGKIERYVKEFVTCPVCGKPDTEIVSEKGVKFKYCLACGAKSPIKYHL